MLEYRDKKLAEEIRELRNFLDGCAYECLKFSMSKNINLDYMMDLRAALNDAKIACQNILWFEPKKTAAWMNPKGFIVELEESNLEEDLSTYKRRLTKSGWMRLCEL